MTELQELRRYRRDLHRIPELDFDLPQTIAYIEGVLAPLACEVTHPCPSCVCAFFDAGTGAAHATAIRADMDALPIAEATGAAFSSTHPGKMHACGHDGHMAMALAAATHVDRTIREQPGVIKRNVLFVFQPAEETTGGAKTVCESGVFERYRADCIFGFHVWPDLPAGTLASCSGPLLARSSETHIHIHGMSIHIAKTYGVPVEESHDAALAAAKFLVSERELMDELGTDEPCIGKFGLLRAGTVCNAVAGEAHVAGSLRVFTDDMFDGKDYTVRSSFWPVDSSFKGDSVTTTVHYDIRLMAISEEYYRYLVVIRNFSISLGDAYLDGLVEPTATYTNVEGGFGIVAGCQLAHRRFTMPFGDKEPSWNPFAVYD